MKARRIGTVSIQLKVEVSMWSDLKLFLIGISQKKKKITIDELVNISKGEIAL